MKVIGNPNGEYRGKLGGMVFGRNKGGAVCRSYVIPTNRNTVSQQKARSRLAAASGGFKFLTGTLVGGWNAFAKSGYNPVNGKTGVEYSGANAFMGIRTTALAGMSEFGLVSWDQTGSPIDAAATVIPFAPVDTAPTSGLSATVKYSTGPSKNLITFEDVVISSEYKAIVTIGLTALDATSGALTGFYDDSGVNCGFALYISTPNKGQGRRYKNKLANTQLITAIPNGLTGSSGGDDITIEQTVAAPVSEWLSAYQLDDYILCSLYLIAADGRRALIGTKEIQVTAP